MKKLIKVIGILLVSSFILLPLKTTAQEPEWSQKLDLTDSVSSAIAKVEDGVVVMQYEGAASENNLLIKYDFNGNKIWTINNDYGYYIESVSDGFIIWSETKITKFDKEGNVLWSNDVELEDTSDRYTANYYVFGSAGLGNKLLEINNNYIICQTHVVSNLHNDFFNFDSDGNLVSRIKSKDLFTTNNISVNDYRIKGVGKTADGNGFFLLYQEYNTSEFYINSFTIDFVLTKRYEYNVEYRAYDSALGHINRIVKMIETEDGYIAAGYQTIYFDKKSNLKIYDRITLDMEIVNDSIYTYEITVPENKTTKIGQAVIVEYDKNLQKSKENYLPFYVKTASAYLINLAGSGFSHIKNRFISYVNDYNEIYTIILNTPINDSRWLYNYGSGYKDSSSINYPFVDEYQTDSNNYELLSYKFQDTNDSNNGNSNNNISGIINNIIKNPQTNSIVIILVIIILILVILMISYFIYKKKVKKIKR